MCATKAAKSGSSLTSTSTRKTFASSAASLAASKRVTGCCWSPPSPAAQAPSARLGLSPSVRCCSSVELLRGTSLHLLRLLEWWTSARRRGLLVRLRPQLRWAFLVKKSALRGEHHEKSMARPPIRVAASLEKSGFYRGGGSRACSGDRRKHRDLQRGIRHFAGSTALPTAGSHRHGMVQDKGRP